jgi:GNAT superfamily N-acetyltransferase
MKVDSELTSLIEFRPVQPADVRFVVDSWLRSYRMSPWAGVIPNHRWFDVMHESVSELLARGAKLLVACNKDAPDQILGWVCHEKVRGGTCIHFVYTKEIVRRRGVASELLRHVTSENDERFYTFRTRASAYFPAYRFAPEIARRKPSSK